MPVQVHPFVFDPASGAWVEDHAAPPVHPPSSLTIVTWNVWFAPYAFEARFRALLEVVRARHPDVICLQEIVPESLELFLAEPWVRAEYRVSDARGDTFDSYGVVLLSRLPVRALALHELPSHMGRKLLVAELDAGPGPLVVGTVHLESLKPNRDTRAVLNEPYAAKIARDWNTKGEARAGFVTRFSVDDAYGARFERRVVGSREHEELWVPAEELVDFNDHLEGPIVVTAAFFGESFTGDVPAQGALKGKNAREQLVALAGMVTDVAGEVAANHQAVFLNFFYWEQLDLAADGIPVVKRDRVLDIVRRSWAQSDRSAAPLGVVVAPAG